MSEHYHRPAEVAGGLRLHLNENTAGCSPRVLEALRTLTASDIGAYPSYEGARRDCAAYFGVALDHVLLCNGLDEGLMALALMCLRPVAGGGVRLRRAAPRQGRRPSREARKGTWGWGPTRTKGCPEALIPEPAFELYAIYTDVAGGRVVSVPPSPDFEFALGGVLDAMTERTRLVFLTSPNNPTGTLIPRPAIREVIRAVPPEAIVFLDEAYADFAGDSFIDELTNHPHLVIGRTFAKSHGLAGIRIGCLLGHPATLAPLLRIVPVYSVNIAAVVALRAALGDRAHVAWYVRQVEDSRARLYAACDRLGLGYVRSAANFVLVRAGDRARALISGLAARGIHVRDRSHQPGCAGCVRITAGLVEDTERCIAAMEDALCGAR